MGSATQTRKVVRSYFEAWTGGDIAACGQYFADDLTFFGTLKRLKSRGAYLNALSEFRALIIGETELISELYGEAEATLIYNAHTVAGVLRTAEHIRLTDDKISSIFLIFDPTALLAYKASLKLG